MKEYIVKISIPAQVITDEEGNDHSIATEAEDVLAMYQNDPTAFTSEVISIFLNQVNRDLK